MEKEEVIQHWSYFCSLAERLDKTKHYVDHRLIQTDDGYTLVHGRVYSDVFKQIIVLSSAEFEVICKALCRIKGHSSVENIIGISTEILKVFPRIIEFEVSTPFWINRPLKDWKVEGTKVVGLPWWNAYNSIKHAEKDAATHATLENAILSLESLYIMELYLVTMVFDNTEIIFTFPNVYLKCKYLSHPISSGDGRLPDFGNLTPKENAEMKYPGLFD